MAVSSVAATGRPSASVRSSATRSSATRSSVVPLSPVTRGEAIALVVLDQLVVGEPAVVHLGLGLVALGLRALGAGLLLGDLGFLLGPIGLGSARRSGLTMLGGDALTARLELITSLALL